MVDREPLSYVEEQWLDVFSKENPFFSSLNAFYGDYGYLTAKQYYYLKKEIDKTEDEGHVVLSKDETRIFKELAKEEAEVRKLLKKYTVGGYFDNSNYEQFIHIINKYLEEDEKIGISHKRNKSDKLKALLPMEQKIIRIPCPHCYFLCSSQLKSCKKCGEPLPKVY